MELKPGEYVGAEKSYSIECFDGEDWYTVNRTHPDFPAAVEALKALVEGTEVAEPIHEWFGLSYANYLVIQRTFLQSMPVAWQARFVALLEELDEASSAWAEREGVELPTFTVHARDNRFTKDPVPHYNRGRTRLDMTGRRYAQERGE